MDDVERPRVLVVVHEAGRSGAPRVAVDVIRALALGDFETRTVLRVGGPLEREFVETSDEVVREPFTWLRVLLRYLRSTRRVAVWLEHRMARRVLSRIRPHLVYLNTVKSACYVRPALEMQVPVLLHVHEDEPLASTTLARYALGELWPRVRLVACADDTRENLARITGMEREAISVLPSPVDVEVVRRHAGLRLRTTDTSVGMTVVACGTADQRKGIDLWLEMAAQVMKARPDLTVQFRWVGRAAVDDVSEMATMLGLHERVAFVGEVANPYPHIAGADLFTLPSRSDPFPLVVLEAMALERPVVAFALPGVVVQLDEAGVLVQPGDASAMARAVIELLEDPERRRTLGRLGLERVRENFGAEQFHSAVTRIVASTLQESGR